MQTPSKYRVTRFAPATPVPVNLLQKFKLLRLDALISAPASFVSNHTHEQGFSDIEWTERITDPSRHHLICTEVGQAQVGGNDRQPVNPTSDEDEWVGMVTLIGPLTREQFNYQGRIGPPFGDDGEETRWDLVGLYIKSQHRCKEAAIAIHEAVLDYLRTNTDELLETVLNSRTGVEKPKRARVAGSKPSPDSLLIDFYTLLGGYETVWVSRAEALKIAGNEELINKCEEEQNMESVLIMEKIVEC